MIYKYHNELTRRNNNGYNYTPQGITNQIKITSGVRQGDVISPTLFILVMTPLLNAMGTSGGTDECKNEMLKNMGNRKRDNECIETEMIPERWKEGRIHMI